MSKKMKKLQPIHTEMVSDNCRLVVTAHDWHIEYDAFTYEEGKDMKYKVTSEKIDKFLSDLKGNLRLLEDLKQQEKKKKNYNVEGLRDMLIRPRGDQPGVYLTDRFLIMKDENDYNNIKEALIKARAIASRVLAEQE